MAPDKASKSAENFYPLPINLIRKSEYPLLEGTTYLDHAGTTPYPKSLIDQYAKCMNSNLFGNPHSYSPASLLSTQCIEETRALTLQFFKADPAYFDLVFVANATAAIKLVADGIRNYDRKRGFWYGYHSDSHTSLVGVREMATNESRCFSSDAEVENWLSLEVPQGLNTEANAGESPSVGLFAYPAQSNMNGRRLPLDWPSRIRKNMSKNHRVYSLLDAAAFVATAQLDLSHHLDSPDFTALSFYKIFGFPDLGALIVRKEAAHVLLKREYFGGGTVDMVINGRGDAWHATKQTSIHEALEDGTPAFHSIAALRTAFVVHSQLFGSMANVSRHAGQLAATLYSQLSALSHANGSRVCTIYKGHYSRYGDPTTQGPTIAFNLRASDGRLIGKSDFEQLAILNGIQLRTGGVCNPGGISSYLDLGPEEMRQNFAEGLRCGNSFDEMNRKPTGIIRVSFGAMSSMNDVQKFMDFMQLFVSQKPTANSTVLRILRRHELSNEKPHAISATPTALLPNPHGDYEKLAELEEVVPLLAQNSDISSISTAQSRCPIAECSKTFELREQMWAHLCAHSLKGGKERSASEGCKPFPGFARRFLRMTRRQLRGGLC